MLSLAIYFISFLDGLVKVVVILLVYFYGHEFPTPSESEVVNADVMGAIEVVNLAICASDARMAYAWNEPCYYRYGGPCDAERVESILMRNLRLTTGRTLFG